MRKEEADGRRKRQRSGGEEGGGLYRARAGCSPEIIMSARDWTFFSIANALGAHVSKAKVIIHRQAPNHISILIYLLLAKEDCV